MDETNFLEELDRRARAARVPIYKVCERAGVAPATVSHWRAKRTTPGVTVMGKIEGALDAIEAERQAA